MDNDPQKKKEPPKNPFMMKGAGIYRWILVALAIMLGLQFLFSWGQQGKTISYSSFRDMVSAGSIAKVEIDQNTILAYKSIDKEGKTATTPDYNVVIPTSIPDNTLMKLLEEKDVKIVALKDNSGVWSVLIWFVLPIAAMIGNP